MKQQCVHLWIATTFSAGVLVSAGQAAEPVEPRGALSELPSPPGAHVKEIESLGNDAWLMLGKPGADPKWGSARGRSWTPKMPYSPALEGAFLCGEGQHGYAKPDGHYMDDLWVYDVNGHRWICAYPGAHTKNLKLKLDRHGFEVNDKGEHIPVGYLAHGYCNMTYIPGLERFLVVLRHTPYWTRMLPQRWDWLDARFPNVKKRNYGNTGPIIQNPKHPLYWDVQAGKWVRKFVAGKGPEPRGFEGVAEYVPSRKQVFFLYHGQVWYYDPAANQWAHSGAKPERIKYDANGCFDSKRNCVYVVQRENFWAFDVEANRWRTIKAKGQPENLLTCSGASLTYDQQNDVVVWMSLKLPGIRIYDPNKNEWKASSPPPKLVWRGRNVNGFYTPKLNAHYYHLAGDSYDNGLVLVYRYNK